MAGWEFPLNRLLSAVALVAMGWSVVWLAHPAGLSRSDIRPHGETSSLDAAVRNKPVALPRAVNPDEARRWRRKTWADENGEIKPGSLRAAMAQRLEILGQVAQRGATRFAGLDPAEWIERGPRNVGGRSRSILIDPNDPNHLLAGAVSGGIWRSTDGGATWTPAADDMKNLAICCLTRDPQVPTTIYAGTGEGFFNGDAIEGDGIFKSVDNGYTWTQLSSTASWDNVCRIAVSPVDSNLILAARRYGGIYRSTNGGGSWLQRRPAQGSFYVAFDPTDGTRAVAHVLDWDGGVGDWVHRAVYSQSSGFSWTVSTGLSGVQGFGARLELAYAPSSPNIVYASNAGDGKIWKSIDGGQSYAIQTAGSFHTGVSWYANPLWVDPTNPDLLVTGGYNFVRSLDGGQTFTQISDGYIMTVQPHVDLHAIVGDPGFDGSGNRRVYVCTDGGVWKTDDIYAASTSGGWQNLDTEYRTTQFYGAAGDGPTGKIIGGTQDNGTLRLVAGSDTANLTFGGDGGFCAIDWLNPNYTYGEYITLNIHRSSNGGASASYITNGLADAGVSANFIAPFILDPNNPQRMLAGGARLWRCPNARAGVVLLTWQQIRPTGTDYISAIAVAEGNSDVIWIAQNNGEIHRTENGLAVSPSWIAVDDNGSANPLPNRYVTRIVIDRDDANVVYVALGGFAGNNLWRTTDGGATWQDVTGAGATGLPSAPIRGIARHPKKPAWLYVGTEVGIFATENARAAGGADVAWTTTHTGPSAVSVDELVFMHGSETLLAATHGRGIYTIDARACLLLGDVNKDGIVDGLDIAGFVRAKLGMDELSVSLDEEPVCADFETGTLEGDVAAFVEAMFQ
ncbi:MAG: hypothetical protein DCC65_09720 [Planctomycetota bacterium]|nr:MAG: hypothetical protein DCC65_09720 [Planctomycetota bacterium]